jgi:acyl-CoA dehydrogenase
MNEFQFELCRLPEETKALRAEVRAFLAEHLRDYPPSLRAYTWTGYDREFSRRVGARGWIGMTWPKQYGGGERSAFERYVVLEEMLAAGAPVGAHWVGDRQSGPLLLRFGTEAQRRNLIPRICRGEITFCIGMSEPDSGSDLASIRARATTCDGGFRISGTKLWTAARTCGRDRPVPQDPGARQARGARFIVDLGRRASRSARPGIRERSLLRSDLRGRPSPRTPSWGRKGRGGTR